MTPHDYLPLIGILVVVLGFAAGFNPMPVVVAAGLVTGLAVGMDPGRLLDVVGAKFLESRQLAVFVLILPVIGILERYGLRERGQAWIAGIRAATATRILILYFAARELSSALGLLNLGGQAQTVRPLLAPMVEGAAEGRHGALPEPARDLIRAHAAATDNIAAFFGEDIFIAFGAVLLADAFLKQNGIADIEPLRIGLWAIPTALVAFAIHVARLTRLEAGIARAVGDARTAGENAPDAAPGERLAEETQP